MSYLLTPTGPFAFHTATTTGDGGILIARGECERLTIVLQSNGTTSGGTVTVEEAYFDPNVTGTYTGTWSVIGSAVSASTFTGGAQSVVHIVGSFWAVRVRISSNITGGGSVTITGWGN